MMAARNRAEIDVAIRTPRLVLSPLDPRYAAALFELLNDWDVVRMLAEVPWPLGYVDVETFLRRDPGGTDAFVILGDLGPEILEQLEGNTAHQMHVGCTQPLGIIGVEDFAHHWEHDRNIIP